MGEVFDEAFPQYLAMGMTDKQFWEEDCALVIPYRKAWKIKQEEQNRFAWLQGLYVYRALQSTPIVVYGFAKKGEKIEPYPGKPFDFDATPEKTAQERYDEQVRLESEKIKAGMFAIMAQQAERKKQREEAKAKEKRDGKE